MFRALSAHLQDDIVVYMQHTVLSQFVVACQYTASKGFGRKPSWLKRCDTVRALSLKGVRKAQY